MILVTGASGTVGKEVLKQVANSGAAHRAMYRSNSEAAKAPAGVETVIADFARKESLAPALRGVESVFLVCSPIPDLVQLEGSVIDECAAAGVRHIVLHSAMGAGDWNKSFPAWHRQVEDKLKATTLSHTILRPNSFHQNVVSFHASTIRTQDAFYSSMKNARNSFIDVRDIAAVAAKALDGGTHSGKTYELNGPEALDYTTLAAKISAVAGRAVRYVDIPMDAQRKAMLDQQMPDWLIIALLQLQEYYLAGKGGQTDELLHKLLGRTPIRMDQFLAENAAEFRAQAATA